MYRTNEKNVFLIKRVAQHSLVSDSTNCLVTALVCSNDSPDRPVWRSKTASHNGKICVNDGVIKRPLLRANVRGGRQCGDGAITRGNTNLTVYP